MYKHILVAVALDDAHDPEQALQVAGVLADSDGLVTVLHVKEQIPVYAIDYIPEDYDDGLKDAIRNRLSAMAARFKKGDGVMLEGHSGRTILEWAGENAVDCIVIASHQPGLRDYLLGGTAAHVVRHAQCSVHVLR
jgi:universal stress protein F